MADPAFPAGLVCPEAFTVLNWTYGLSADMGCWPHLLACMLRVGERPKVREAGRAEKEKLAA